METSKLQDDRNSAIKAGGRVGRGANWIWFVSCSGCYALLLMATISGWSLWTDEAFSAYIACHRTLRSLVSTLIGGDSSDLQAAMYYIYLHLWTTIFGASEVALRSANIPFIVLFAFIMVWASFRVFRSRWMWIVPACMPFLWFYAAQVRAYFALVAFSMVCFTCLLAYIEHPSEKERKILPWLILASLFVGTTFDMLMLLSVAPMGAILAIYWRQRSDSVRWIDWRPALARFAVPFIALFAYLSWTFGRGTAYDYAKPSILSMASVIYRLVGFLGYGPNRRYDIPFRPYLFGMVLAGIVFVIAITGAVVVALRAKSRLRLISLSCAFALGIVEVTALSMAIRQQMDVRHLASLVPLMLFWPLAALAEPSRWKPSRLAWVSAVLLASVWLIADCRLVFLPEYKEEDFRSAVNKAIELQQMSGAVIALVADPAAGAYYGLALQSRRPCFPLADDCASGFKKVDWALKAPAVEAQLWKEPQVKSWLNEVARTGVPVVVIMSQCRHPMLKDSAWWPIVRAEKQASIYPIHRFLIYFFR